MTTARVIVVSDRVCSGARTDAAGPAAKSMLLQAGIETDGPVIIPEGKDAIAAELDRALADQVRIVVTIGGTGHGERNLTPEETAARLAVRLTGIETQILIEGLKSTTRAGLSRGLVGLTERGDRGTLIVNSAGSVGAVRDSLGIVVPLIDAIFEKF